MAFLYPTLLKDLLQLGETPFRGKQGSYRQNMLGIFFGKQIDADARAPKTVR